MKFTVIIQRHTTNKINRSILCINYAVLSAGCACVIIRGHYISENCSITDISTLPPKMSTLSPASNVETDVHAFVSQSCRDLRAASECGDHCDCLCSVEHRDGGPGGTGRPDGGSGGTGRPGGGTGRPDGGSGGTGRPGGPGRGGGNCTQGRKVCITIDRDVSGCLHNFVLRTK